MVLLHAFGASGRSFDPVLRRLDGVEVHAPDLPGFGGAAPLDAPSVAAYADWAAAFVDRAGLRDMVLGGWSMGGKVAVALAARRPAWLKGLVLMAPSPPSPEPMDEADRARQLTGHGDAQLSRRSVRDLIVADPPAAWLDAAVADRLRTDETAWRWWLDQGSRETVDAGALAIPTLLVVGAQDPGLGEAVQRERTLPAFSDVRLRRIERCGHFLPIEAPDALSRMLSDWTAAPAGST